MQTPFGGVHISAGVQEVTSEAQVAHVVREEQVVKGQVQQSMTEIPITQEQIHEVVVPEVQPVQKHKVQKHIEAFDETKCANKDMDTAMEGLSESSELQDMKEDCRNTVMLHWTNTRFQEGLSERSEAKAVAEVAKRIAMGAIFKSSGCAGSNYALLAVATAALVRLGTQLTDAHQAGSESGLSDSAESALPSSVVDEVTESDADEAMHDEELLEP